MADSDPGRGIIGEAGRGARPESFDPHPTDQVDGAVGAL